MQRNRSAKRYRRKVDREPLGKAALTGRWIELRPVTRADYPVLYEWRTDALEFHLWDSFRRLPTLDDFCRQTDELLRKTISFLIATKDTGRPIGLVQAYGLNPEAGWCFTLVYVVSAFRRKPHAAEAYIALLESLFRTMPIRKVYADLFEFTIHAAKPLMAGGFVEEGRFKQHTWHDDRYWDVYRLAMYREQWNEVRDRARLLLGVGEEVGELLSRTGGDGDGAFAAPTSG